MHTSILQHIAVATALVALISACSGDKSTDSTAPATGAPLTGTTSNTGIPGGTPTGTGTGSGTGTGTATGTGTGTGTATGTTPQRTLVVGCDPTWCTMTTGGGANGGDLCSCTFDGPDHPVSSFVEASCFGGGVAPVGFDLTLHLDLTAMGYAGYAVDACAGAYPGDSSLAVFEDDPLNLGAEVECIEDAIDEYTFCAKITDPGIAGQAPWPTAAPATGQAWIVVDEWDTTAYWNGATPRTVDFELFTSLPVCGDGTPEFNEECDDGNVVNGDGCDEFCQREPVCGDGYIDTPETCDDGNILPDDGCDETCQLEPFEIEDCDPTWCTWTPGGGPTGGDLCSCTLTGADHPQLDALGSVCGAYGSPDVVFSFDRASYAAISADTCQGGAYNGGDSVVVLYGDDPYTGTQAAVCNDDSGTGLCSQIWDTGVANDPAGLVNLPAGGGRVYVQVDGFAGLDWWDGLTDRTVEIELSTTPGSVCGNGTLEPLEECDDGNLSNDDRCSDQCEDLPFHIQDCDPTWCTLTAAGGPNGGDLCECTIPGVDHPSFDEVGLSCSGFSFVAQPEVIFSFDKGAYASVSGSTCDSPLGTGTYYPGYTGYYYQDSAIALFNGDPLTGGPEVACNNDATGFGNGCSRIWDTGNAVDPAGLVNVPPNGSRVYFAVDDTTGGWWDGATDRIVSFELSTTAASTCGDGTVELTEQCDDGNLVDGDGCSAECFFEPVVITDCDPTYCTLTAAAGPNGGDLCDCTIPAANHPQLDAVGDASCFGGTAGNEVLFFFDVSGGAYTTYSIDTCSTAQTAYADSSVATYAGDPTQGSLELECNEDAYGYYSYCSKLIDSGYNTPPTPAALPISGELWISIDEWNAGEYWNGTDDRQFLIELIP